MSSEALRKTLIKEMCEADHLFFTRYFFKIRQGIKFKVNWHHIVIASALQAVMDGKIENLVINVPPGYSKTEMAVINFIARGLAINPRSRYLHISYSDDLALLNSQTAREIVMLDEYQELWQLRIADDAKAKKRWNVKMARKNAGGVYAVSLNGQITGFRAGHMAPGFQGAIIIDDPLKVADANSKRLRAKANEQLVQTVKSRRASPQTPIIVIMQRLTVDDPTGYIKSGKMPGKWTFINIPALIDDNYIEDLPLHIRNYVRAMEMVELVEEDEHGRRSTWQEKEPLKDLIELEQKSPRVFTGQYMQNPTIQGGNLIKGDNFPLYTVQPHILYRKIYADTAMKIKEHNDFSVFQCWGFADDNRIYLLDQIRGKWEAPELKRRAIAFWNKHAEFNDQVGFGQLRVMKVEDKSSGTGLIQELTTQSNIPIEGIIRVKDKLTRLMDVLDYQEAGRVCLPADAPWLSDFVSECEAFTPDNTHEFDDQVDPMMDAINDMLTSRNELLAWENLISNRQK